MAYLKENEDLRRTINFDTLEKKTFAELFNVNIFNIQNIFYKYIY